MVTLLLLSDFHFDSMSDGPIDSDQGIRNALLHHLKTQEDHKFLEYCAGICICGDIAYRGEEEEYEKAEAFLAKLLEILPVDKKDIFPVMGNHDVNRTFLQEVETQNCYESLKEAPNQSEFERSFKRFYGNSSKRHLLYASTENFLQDFYSHYQTEEGEPYLYWTKELRIDHYDIQIRGFNSALISGEDKDKDGNPVPMRILESQFNDLAKDRFSITFCHHPPSCWWRESLKLKSTLDSLAQIQIYGHMHQHDVHLSTGNMEIFCGAVHPVRDKQWTPQFAWLDLEVKEHTLFATVHSRSLDTDDHTRFIPDKVDKCHWDLAEFPAYSQEKKSNMVEKNYFLNKVSAKHAAQLQATLEYFGWWTEELRAYDEKKYGNMPGRKPRRKLIP